MATYIKVCGFVSSLASNTESNSRAIRCIHIVRLKFSVKNIPLKHDEVKWKSEVPLTQKQLLEKRREFWETAPVFEGRKEIWDALRGAAVALEQKDFTLAQAILNGANVYLPRGMNSEPYSPILTANFLEFVY